MLGGSNPPVSIELPNAIRVSNILTISRYYVIINLYIDIGGNYQMTPILVIMFFAITILVRALIGRVIEWQDASLEN